MSKLVPNCQYFEWPPLIPITALTLLGMVVTSAAQVATASLTKSRMDIGDLALLQLPFEDTPQTLSRVQVGRHACPVHHL